jgi:hypothetical protein
MSDLHERYIRALQTMGEDNSAWINAIFKYCVILLVDIADWLGITYEFINIIVFVVVWPAVTLLMAIWILVLKVRIRRLKRAK